MVCRSDPFGATEKSIEEFSIYTTDFSAQSDGGMKAALLEVINGSRVTLHCAFSSLTLGEVSSALIARARSGIQVKAAFDADIKETDAGSLALQSSGAFNVITSPVDTAQSQLLYGNSGTGVMRHTFCMADERYIYISTAGADDTLMRKTPNVAFKIGSPQFGLARDFLREASMFSQLLFGTGKAKTDFTTKFTALDQVIGAYWGPQEDPMDILGTELSEARGGVDFYSTSFQATNTTSSKSYLDVPTVLKSLESAKNLPLKKYFSSAALFDTASKAYTLTNPSLYQNTDVKIGPQIFVMDRGLSSAKAFIYTGSLRSQANSSDDGVLIELRGRRATDMIGAYLDRIGALTTVVSNVGDTGNAQDVIITEILWPGSYSSGQVSDSGDEFIELYNRTGATINLSGWKFACTTNPGTGTPVSSYLTIPSGAVIAAGGYFVIAAKSTGAIQNANHFDSAVSVTNSTQQCKLTNGKAVPATTYSGETGFTGDVIDTIGVSGSAFDSTASMGLNDTTNKVRRSMERINYNALADNTTNWRTNIHSYVNNPGITAGFRDNTFASPGTAGATTSALALTNPSFESDTNSCTVATRDGSNNVTSVTGTCPAGWTISISSANGIIFNSLAGTTPAGGGANYSTLSSFTTTYTSREIRTTSCLALNKSNPLDISGWYLKDTTNSTQVRHLVYYFTDAACTTLATGGTNPTIFTGQSITAQNTWENKTNQAATTVYPSETTLYIRLGIQAQRATGGIIQYDLISLSN